MSEHLNEYENLREYLEGRGVINFDNTNKEVADLISLGNDKSVDWLVLQRKLRIVEKRLKWLVDEILDLPVFKDETDRSLLSLGSITALCVMAMKKPDDEFYEDSNNERHLI